MYVRIEVCAFSQGIHTRGQNLFCCLGILMLPKVVVTERDDSESVYNIRDCLGENIIQMKGEWQTYKY